MRIKLAIPFIGDSSSPMSRFSNTVHKTAQSRINGNVECMKRSPYSRSRALHKVEESNFSL